jgi:hypothetical protein
VTFKDLKKRVTLEAPNQQSTRLFKGLQNKPFWIGILMNTGKKISEQMEIAALTIL